MPYEEFDAACDNWANNGEISDEPEFNVLDCSCRTFSKMNLDVITLIQGDLGAACVLITFGVILGKVSFP
jgi:hypothetical protein